MHHETPVAVAAHWQEYGIIYVGPGLTVKGVCCIATTYIAAHM